MNVTAPAHGRAAQYNCRRDNQLRGAREDFMRARGHFVHAQHHHHHHRRRHVQSDGPPGSFGGFVVGDAPCFVHWILGDFTNGRTGAIIAKVVV